MKPYRMNHPVVAGVITDIGAREDTSQQSNCTITTSPYPGETKPAKFSVPVHASVVGELKRGNYLVEFYDGTFMCFDPVGFMKTFVEIEHDPIPYMPPSSDVAALPAQEHPDQLPDVPPGFDPSNGEPIEQTEIEADLKPTTESERNV